MNNRNNNHIDINDIDFDEQEIIYTLTLANGKPADFRELAVIEYEDNNYIILSPTEPNVYFNDGDVLIYRVILDENNEEVFDTIKDQKLIDEVFAYFQELVCATKLKEE